MRRFLRNFDRRRGVVERKIRRISPALAQFENCMETAQLDNAPNSLPRHDFKGNGSSGATGYCDTSIPLLNGIERAER
jgi:hypothetical protein